MSNGKVKSHIATIYRASVELAVAVESKPSIKGEVFAALMRFAGMADPDV